MVGRPIAGEPKPLPKLTVPVKCISTVGGHGRVDTLEAPVAGQPRRVNQGDSKGGRRTLSGAISGRLGSLTGSSTSSSSSANSGGRSMITVSSSVLLSLFEVSTARTPPLHIGANLRR